ncbi:hypothetical protein RJT34_28166 [Clitoria ternatea]|uniref:Transcription repressor n=1 Tax=Clitoria ternatea TaxID=43366 RepID=A0AAN9IBD2_CLITE
MPKTKKIQDYLFKIKSPRPQIKLPFNSLTSPKNWVLSGCKHPRTPSFASYARNEANYHHHNNNINHRKNDAATLADVDRFLLENFKSLFLKDNDELETVNNNYKNTIKRVVSEEEEEETPKLGSILFESPRLVETPRDLRGSTRFFVEPGFSGSLVEDASTSTKSSEEEGSSSMMSTTTFLGNDVSSSMNSRDGIGKEDDRIVLPDNSIALITHSASPFEDFKRSMQEMVEANKHEGGNTNTIDWDFMEELLFCYLNLNEKKSHKFILSAFVDLIAVMRRNSDTASTNPRSVRTVRTASVKE